MRRNEHGFTLPEVLVVILIMGILFAISASSWRGVTEGRRVTSASNQLAADMRLAHTNATNQLTSWRLVLVPGQNTPSDGADYLLVKLDPAGNVVGGSQISRTLPDNTYIVDQSNLNDGPVVRALHAALGLDASDPSRTLEFVPDGSMKTYSNPAAANKDLIEVTDDGDPKGKVRFNETTARIKVG